MKLTPGNILYVKGGLGHYHRVTALFVGRDATSQANAYLAVAPTEAVIAVFDDLVFIAAVDDPGIQLPPISLV